MLALATVRFLAELAMLVALGWIGFRAPDSLPLSVLLAALLPVIAATIWGRFVAPRAKHRLEDPWRLAVEVILFGSTVAGLVGFGEWPWGLALGLGYVASAPAGRAGL